MDNISLIELLQREIRRTACDVRAETLVALALEAGLLHSDLVVNCDQLFSREFSKDVVSTEIKEDARKKQFLQLHLSRSGIFDQLPEGLFFQPREQRSRGMNAGDMAADHKFNKKKEEEIRRFFQPFENDFFWQQVQVEREESRFLEGLQDGILNDYFVEFWNIPASIPREFIAPLILLLPYAHRIAGDLSLTAQCLRQLLQEEVQVKKAAGIQVEATEAGAGAGIAAGLGEALLGLDLVCGEKFTEDYLVMEWVIGPLIGSRVQDYLEAGKRWVLLETFRRFFVPAGVDTVLTILLQEEKYNMILEKGMGPVLGYSSVLG